jgi:lipopolysaccharide/colanic/teichoic acid biosynthesis glycosyltransferase
LALKGPEYLSSNRKRQLDIVGGLTLLGGTSLLSAGVGIEAMIEHRRLNPIFRQRRIGRDGREVTVYKYESIHDKGDPAELRGGSKHPGASKIGTLVRATCLDELPQFVNVVKGDLSLVGARPLPSTYLEYYRSFIPEELFTQWKECYDMNVGLTGEGQMFTKRYPEHTEQVVRRRMEIEITATESASLKNDLRVLAATPAQLLVNLLSSAPPPLEPAYLEQAA